MIEGGGGHGRVREGGRKGEEARHRFPAWRRISNDDGVVVGTVVK